MNLLNIGCGGHFHPAWTNIDLVSTAPEVRAYDLRKGLPYAENSFDAAYTSHVLEHLTPHHARISLQEQFRVLKKGGIVRVVVPDLENKAREYVRLLDEMSSTTTSPNTAQNHEWMILELLDQMVRTKVGGEMGAYILRPNLANAQYLIERIGDEAEEWLKVAQNQASSQQGSQAIAQKSLLQKALSKSPSFLVQKVREALAQVAVRFLAGSGAAAAFKESLFRSSGELHLWMYDRISLGQLLQEVGFSDIRVCRFDESRIPNFSSYLLDSTPQGTVRKADSLFMEARKG